MSHPIISAQAIMAELLNARLVRPTDPYPYSEYFVESDTKDHVLRVNVAGFSEDELEITTEDEKVVIRGIVCEAEKQAQESRDYRYSKIRQKDFEREIAVPDTLDITKMSAKLDRGILELRFPLTDVQKARLEKRTIKLS